MAPSTHQHNAGNVPATRPAQQTGRHFRRVLVALRILLAALILIALTQWSGPEEVLTRFTEFPLPVALSCVLLAILIQVLAATRLGVLARSQGLPISTAESLGINLSAIFYGLFLPGGNATGWAVRLLRMSSGAVGVAAALLVLSGDRALATATGAAIGAVADALLKGPATFAVSVLLVTVAVAAGGLACVLLTAIGGQVLAKFRTLPGLGRLVSMLPQRSRLPNRPGPGVILLGLGLSIAAHAIGISIWVWLAWSLGLDIDPLTIAWVRSASMIVGLLPATIGGLGLREGAAVYLLTSLGVSSADALSLSLLAFAATVLAMGFLGGLAEAGRLLPRRQESQE